MEGGVRDWSLTRGPRLAEVAKLQWSCTIANVSLESGERYAAAVQRWARAILADTDALARLESKRISGSRAVVAAAAR
jgi:hypothetical protein